jgi:hypothetical protein
MLLKMYQATCSDAHVLTIGETSEGHQVLLSIRGKAMTAQLDIKIDAEIFDAICDLKYRLQYSAKTEKPYLAKVA